MKRYRFVDLGRNYVESIAGSRKFYHEPGYDDAEGIALEVNEWGGVVSAISALQTVSCLL